MDKKFVPYELPPNCQWTTLKNISELSKKFRAENNLSLDDWQKKLGEVCKINPPKIYVKDLPDDLKVSFLPMAAVSIDGEIINPQIKLLGEVKKGYTNFIEDNIKITSQ